MSPDTDVYNIGLALQSAKDKQVVIQVSTYSARELKFVLLNNLVTAFSNDPDLAQINARLLPQIIQVIYICTFWPRQLQSTFGKPERYTDSDSDSDSYM